jgi:hypothetical protein
MDEAQLRERMLRSFDEVLRPLYLEVEASIAEDLHVQIAEHVLQILKDGVEERPALTQEQEDAIRRIVAEEIKQLEKRITNVVIYDLSQRMKLMGGKKEQA